MTQLNGHTPSAALIALLTYSVSGIDFMLLPDGSLFINGAHLEQREAWALSVCLTLPGMRATLNRIERTRQAAIVQRLIDDEDSRIERLR